jgi:two-component system, oxyanion-binding sensor
MVRWGQVELRPEDAATVHGVYRPDLYREALQSLRIRIPEVDIKVEGTVLSGEAAANHGPFEGFFDGRRFDPEQLSAYCAGFR